MTVYQTASLFSRNRTKKSKKTKANPMHQKFIFDLLDLLSKKSANVNNNTSSLFGEGGH